MRVALVSPPTSEPITLEEAKLYLRVDTDADDTEIMAALAAARVLCENAIDRSFLATVWALYLDDWPGDNAARMGPVIVLPRADVLAVGEISYTAPDGTPTVLAPALYRATLGAPARIAPAWGHAWPSARCDLDGVRVEFTAGWDPDAVPPNVKQSVKLALAHLYQNRGDVDAAELPPAARDLLAPSAWAQIF